MQLSTPKKISFNHPMVMGILNLSPQSFSSQGRFTNVNQAVDYALSMIEEGAEIIDIGAEATNPCDTETVSPEEELKRINSVLEILRKKTDVLISIDTSQPMIMREVVKLGADIINDVRGLQLPGALETMAELDVPVCIMHMKYISQQLVADKQDETEVSRQLVADKQDETEVSRQLVADKQIVTTVKDFFAKRLSACEKAGIKKEKIILDPGFGTGKFKKDLQENLLLLRSLEIFHEFNLPLLVGVSRKTFIREILNTTEDKSIFGSVAANVYAYMKGANIFRVHDVKATVDALRVVREIKNTQEI